MSIRLRFTLLYNAILAVTLALFGTALYAVQAHNTLSALRDDLTHTSTGLGEAILRVAENPAAYQPQPRPRQFEEFSGEKPFKELREREIVRVLDPKGQLVASPFGRNEDALPLSSSGLEQIQAGSECWEFAEVNDQPMLIYNRALALDGKVIYILQVARSLAERNRSLDFLASSFSMASLFTILIAFGVGWVFSGLTLNPIKKLTHSAQAIGDERDFTRRVAYQGPQDEVGQLASTLNSMLTRLQDAYQQVAHSLEMQRNFVADVSHELRTPLTTLRGNLGLLQRKPPIPAAEQTDILTDMTEESDRLIRLVNELLVLARADAGRNLSHEPLPILPVLDEACRQARQLDMQRHITIDSPHLVVLGDRDALKQVLLVTLDNALKHSTGKISVSAFLNGSKVEIRVQDLGPGISPDKLSHVFDRFYRGESNPESAGFGLGLPIARALVEGMGGQINLESQPGHGTVVVMSFLNGDSGSSTAHRA